MASDYPSDWDSRRHDIYERDGYQCQNCGAGGGPHGSADLHAHHIVPKSKGGTHKRSNLISVCRDCHNAIHGDSQAPTSTNRSSTISSERELYASLVDVLESVAECEAKSNDALDRLINQLEAVGDGYDFTVEEYTSIRYGVIKQAFHIKEKIDQYESTTRKYLDKDAQTDIDAYIDAAWDSIQAKINVIGHVDDLFMEFTDRDIECTGCGEIVESGAQYCNNCGKDLKLEHVCSSCGSSLDAEDNFCTNCGSEVQEKQTPDKQLDVNEEHVEMHVSEIRSEIDDTVNKAIFVQLQQEKFVEIWIEDRDVPWDYCPNCGFERGVLSSMNQAICILCEAEWNKKGILNRRWEVVEGSNIRADIDGSETHWGRLGREKSKEGIYKQKIPELQDRV